MADVRYFATMAVPGREERLWLKGEGAPTPGDLAEVLEEMWTLQAREGMAEPRDPLSAFDAFAVEDGVQRDLTDVEDAALVAALEGRLGGQSVALDPDAGQEADT